ncbi:MAG: DUF2334 domain-containing protein [Cocleimonas sp.]
MFAKYIIRMDDACPTMNRKHWDQFEVLLNKYNIKPIVAVIPNNKDETLMVDEADSSFWQKVKDWQNNGWHIALHGYEHLYVNENAGIVPINNRSEFSGLPYGEQKQKIEKGINIFKQHDIDCNVWVAPSHSFDHDTIKALKEVTNIKIISDGIAFSPFSEHGMRWIPQQLWRPRKMPFGTWTICYHPETITDKQFKALTDFIEENHQKFICIDSLSQKSRKKNLVEKFFEGLYWKMLKSKQNAV